MSRIRLAAALLFLTASVACTWPPKPSAPVAQNPARTAEEETQAARPVQPPSVKVPRVAPPALSIPRAGGGLL